MFRIYYFYAQISVILEICPYNAEKKIIYQILAFDSYHSFICINLLKKSNNINFFKFPDLFSYIRQKSSETNEYAQNHWSFEYTVWPALRGHRSTKRIDSKHCSAAVYNIIILKLSFKQRNSWTSLFVNNKHKYQIIVHSAEYSTRPMNASLMQVWLYMNLELLISEWKVFT